MKHRLLCLAASLLALLLFPACSKNQKAAETPATPEPYAPDADQVRELEQSGIWTLGERYPLTYSSLNYISTYESNGEPFCMKVSRNKKETGMSQRVRESRTVNGLVFALCESKKKDADGNAAYTYYECYTGSFRYFIGRESNGFFIENFLSMDDAIALMWTPESPKDAVKCIEVEWNAQYRTDACNLEILIRPSDGGALAGSLSSSYTAYIEGDDTYYISSAGDDIVYSNGVHSVQIRQANRSGAEAFDYHTLSECKAILALLG